MSGVKGKSGRKSKEEDLQMIEKLTPLDNMAFNKLKEGLEAGEFAYLKLYFLYRWGKPIATKDITITSEQPIFSL